MASNVARVTDSMNCHLNRWSARRLTLIGKILIVKTYAVSQLIYLMQTFCLTDDDLKKFNCLIFKYIWNKNLKANRAVERISREKLMRPTSDGGFGMIDIYELDKALKLKAWGRLQTTKHPYLMAIRDGQQNNGIKSTFLETKVPVDGDQIMRKGAQFLTIERKKILGWPGDIQVKSTVVIKALSMLKATECLTDTGKNSLTFLRIRTRNPNILITQLTDVEIMDLARHLKWPGLDRTLLLIKRQGIRLPPDQGIKYLIPTSNYNFVNLTETSSKNIRTLTRTPGCHEHKLAMGATKSEVMSWAERV